MMDELLDGGLIILDKPPRKTSHEITTYVKKLLKIKRTGHAGTLDPNVSGVLPVALGRATKLLKYITFKEKTYVGIMKFKHILPREKLEELFGRYVGEIEQTPPKEAAVRRKKRKRTIHYLKVLEIKERLVLFETKVEAGTYIRTLCEDIGKKVGGGRMEELRRIRVGEIDEQQAVRMEDLIDVVWLWKNKGDECMLKQMVKPIEQFMHMKKIIVKNSAVKNLIQGAQLMGPGVKEVEDGVEKGEVVKMLTEDGKFLGVGIALLDSNSIRKKEKVQIVKTERIHLQLNEL